MDDNLDARRNGDSGQPAEEVDNLEVLDQVVGFVESWQIHPDSPKSETLRQVVLSLIAKGYDAPGDWPEYVVPMLVTTIGQLEAELREVREQLDQVIEILRRRQSGS